eukprot:maker-scaffold180_size281610-snap-gene-0.38 protein:Tk11862 transcript:maker-scaffold180_size281610-snap-gene-0.38-mRNA-1 annotation:"coiled-coil domain-containing protein 22 isoform x2"
MDPGDKILIQRLRQLGLDLEEDAQLHKMTAEEVMLAVVQCLAPLERDRPMEGWKALPRDPEALLPASLSERFHLGTTLAQNCLALGFPEAGLGYQSFLYPNENDLRKIFTFLLDLVAQLEDEDQSEQTTSEDLRPADESHDEFCTCSECFREIELDISMIHLLPKESRNAAFNLLTRAHTLAQIPAHSPSPSPPMVHNASDRPNPVDPDVPPSGQLLEKLRPPKPEVKPKPSNLVPRAPTLEALDRTALPDEATPQPSETNLLRLELKALKLQAQDNYDRTRDRYTATRNDVIALRRSLKEERNTRRDARIDLERKREEVEKRKKLLNLMPDGEANVEKLKGIVLKNRARMESYEKQWDHTKAALCSEQQTLELALATQPISASPMQEVNSKIADLEAKLREVEASYKKFASLLKRIQMGEPRSSYTKRILDVLKSIARQRLETERIIQDIKSTQKDINLLDGKLFRTYAEVDRIIFDTATKDSSYIPAYKMVTNLHHLCQEIIDRIGANGKVKRLVRDLRSQVENEKAKSIQANAQSLEADLSLIKSENDALLAKIQAQTG